MFMPTVRWICGGGRMCKKCVIEAFRTPLMHLDSILR